jgi:DNA-binding NtrC family response regulator
MNQRLQNVPESFDTEAIRVLVVDDEPIIRDLLRAMLVNMKAEVDVAENGVEAQRKILSGSYELVITDINMPEMDGITLLRWLKKKKPAIETVVMTGYDITEEMLETIGKSAMEFFNKPPEPKKIRITIQHCRERLRSQEKV